MKTVEWAALATLVTAVLGGTLGTGMDLVFVAVLAIGVSATLRALPERRP